MTGLVVVLVVLVAATLFGVWRTRRDGAVRPVPEAAGEPPVLNLEELDGRLGARATLVQFSSAFCQPCRAVRGTLAHVAASVEGVEHVEIDAESRLDLVRRLKVSRTPTTFILDGDGRVISRATGVLRLNEVRDALPVS